MNSHSNSNPHFSHHILPKDYYRSIRGMFDFQRLEVYNKSRDFYLEMISIAEQLDHSNKALSQQLKRAALSIPLNIAESTGRFTPRDRRNFLVIARGSVVECAALLDILLVSEQLDGSSFQTHFDQATQISKMLFAMIRNLGNQ